MSNYSDNEGSVRVDVFKARGKWYTTLALDMSKCYEAPLLHDAIRAAMREQGHGNWLCPDYICVVLEPYHQHSHPVMLKEN